MTSGIKQHHSANPRENYIVAYLQRPSNLSTFIHLPAINHLTAQVYSFIIFISFSISVPSLIFSELLQPLLSLCCTSSLERTLKRPPSPLIRNEIKSKNYFIPTT